MRVINSSMKSVNNSQRQVDDTAQGHAADHLVIKDKATGKPLYRGRGEQKNV